MSSFSVAFIFSRNDALLQEKEELEELFEAIKSEVMLSRDGAAAKQIKILKQAIRNLEVCLAVCSVCVCVCVCACAHACTVLLLTVDSVQEELAKERSKHQRYVQKKTQEIRELMEEVSSLSLPLIIVTLAQDSITHVSKFSLYDSWRM